MIKLSIWNYFMKCRVRKFFSRLLLLGVLVLSISLISDILNTATAAAAIRQLEEAPGQVVYQSRETLKDQQGNRWGAIAFKRIRPDGKATFELRLVGFPGMAEIDRTKPLLLTNSLRKTWQANDASANIFTDQIQPHVGQYDLQPLITQLETAIPLTLSLATVNGEPVKLSISPSLVQEWQTVANY